MRSEVEFAVLSQDAGRGYAGPGEPIHPSTYFLLARCS